MLIVKLKSGESIDAALKRLKYKVAKTKQVEQLRERTEFTSKSEKRRDEIKRASYHQRKKSSEE